MNTGQLKDFRDSTSIADASREELEAWYNFQNECLAILIHRAGGSVDLDWRDVALHGYGQWKIFVEPVDSTHCKLKIVKVGE